MKFLIASPLILARHDTTPVVNRIKINIESHVFKHLLKCLKDEKNTNETYKLTTSPHCGSRPKYLGIFYANENEVFGSMSFGNLHDVQANSHVTRLNQQNGLAYRIQNVGHWNQLIFLVLFYFFYIDINKSYELHAFFSTNLN